MATFVLVHGLFHGGWCWKKVVPLLRAAGHECFAPTLTGLGERAHLLTRDIDLDTHVQDIVGMLECEDLRDVLLVGHSYAGLVITGVAARLPERIRHLVYLDAMFPMDDDRSFEELQRRLQPELWAAREGLIRERGDGWLLPVPAGDTIYDVSDAGDVRWLRERLTPQTVTPLRQRVAGDETTDRLLPRTYVSCPTPAGTSIAARYAERARRDGWPMSEVAGGHDAMVTMPQELSALLLTLATRTAQITGES